MSLLRRDWSLSHVCRLICACLKVLVSATAACLVFFFTLCVRKVLFSALWPPYSPFLGKPETKLRKAIAGKEKGTGKLTLGRSEGESPHSTSHKERSWSVWGWLSGTRVLTDRNKKVRHRRMPSHPVTFRSSFTAFRPLKGAPRVFSRVIWL